MKASCSFIFGLNTFWYLWFKVFIFCPLWFNSYHKWYLGFGKRPNWYLRPKTNGMPHQRHLTSLRMRHLSHMPPKSPHQRHVTTTFLKKKKKIIIEKSLGVAELPPWPNPISLVPATSKDQRERKTKKVWPLGVAEPPPFWPRGWFSHP
jgi:hypothetical protein